MNTADIVIILIIGVIIGAAVAFIWRSKKNGKKCIGCPDNCACSGGNCSGGCTGCNEK